MRVDVFARDQNKQQDKSFIPTASEKAFQNAEQLSIFELSGASVLIQKHMILGEGLFEKCVVFYIGLSVKIPPR